MESDYENAMIVLKGW